MKNRVSRKLHLGLVLVMVLVLVLALTLTLTLTGKRVRDCCIILENNTSDHRCSSKIENVLNVIIDNYDN